MNIVSEVPQGYRDVVFYEPHSTDYRTLVALRHKNVNLDLDGVVTLDGRVRILGRRTALALVESGPDLTERHVVVAWIGCNSADQFSKKAARMITLNRAVDRLLCIKYHRKGEHPLRTLEFTVIGHDWRETRHNLLARLMAENIVRVTAFDPLEK
jgi:hypothetical protein